MNSSLMRGSSKSSVFFSLFLPRVWSRLSCNFNVAATDSILVVIDFLGEVTGVPPILLLRNSETVDHREAPDRHLTKGLQE